MCRRLVCCAVSLLAAMVLLAGSFAHSTPAGAQVTIDRWDLTQHGSAHTVLNANHLTVSRQDCNGCGLSVADIWIPWYCQLAAVLPGNGVGDPLRIRLYPPIGHGLACLPNAYDPLYGWATGTGWAEGQNFWAGWCVGQRVFLIPFRNPNLLDSYGTELTVC